MAEFRRFFDDYTNLIQKSRLFFRKFSFYLMVLARQ